MNEHYFSYETWGSTMSNIYKFVLKNNCVRTELLMLMTMSITIFWDVTLWSMVDIALTFQSNVTTHLPVYRALHARRQTSSSIMWLVHGYDTWEIPNLHCGWWRDDVQWWVQYALAWCAPGPLVPDAHSLHPVHCHIQSILYCVCPSGKLRLFEC